MVVPVKRGVPLEAQPLGPGVPWDPGRTRVSPNAPPQDLRLQVRVNIHPSAGLQSLQPGPKGTCRTSARGRTLPCSREGAGYPP